MQPIVVALALQSEDPKKTLSPTTDLINLKSKNNFEITGAQIRAGRALLRWSAKDLAAAAGIGVATVSRAEVVDGTPPLTKPILQALTIALSNAGIEFINDGDGTVGVKFGISDSSSID